jgi:hypothetical protein
MIVSVDEDTCFGTCFTTCEGGYLFATAVKCCEYSPPNYLFLSALVF